MQRGLSFLRTLQQGFLAVMDKLTQLQEQQGILSFEMFNSVGLLQRDAPPSSNKEDLQEFKKRAKEMGERIIDTALAFDKLVDDMPPAESYKTEQEQIEKLQQLQLENEKHEVLLRQKQQEAEQLLAQVSYLLKEIATDKFQNVQ